MMNAISLTLYILSATSVIITLYACYALYRRFPLLYLLHYLYFISAFFVAGFIDLVGTHLAATMLTGQEPHTVMLLNHIFAFLVFPFIPLATYFYFSFMAGFIEQKIPNYLRHVYGSFWALFFLVLVITTKNFLSSRDAGISTHLFFALDNISYLVYVAVPVWGLIMSRGLEETFQRRAVRIFGLIALCGFAASWMVSERLEGHSFGTHPLHIFVYFAINLPSLFYVRYYLSRFPPAPDPLPLMQETDLEGFYGRFGLSNREREIVRLMLTGKSNKEIAGELFVSTHTIKNHVYNIYQKLQVSNRLHFIRTIQNHLQNKVD
jgi:DNA-binding CsgD family transcriptional regulator